MSHSEAEKSHKTSSENAEDNNKEGENSKKR
jgi:hypothetical protein